MKKFLLLFLVFVFAVSFTGCVAKIDPIGEIQKKPEMISEKIIGTWTIAEAEFENSEDPLKNVMSNLVRTYMEKGSKVIFEEGGSAVINGTNVTYSLNWNILTLTWDDSKNFLFEISFDGAILELEMEDAAEFKLKK